MIRFELTEKQLPKFLKQLDTIRLGLHKDAKAAILDEADSERGLRPPRGLSTEQQLAAFEAKDLSAQKTDASIKELQERIVYLEKQVEFLKKFQIS